MCSEASTAVGTGVSGILARPPLGTAARYNETFVPRKMEFKGWVTDYSQRFVDWEQTRAEQGSWPTKKRVSWWFKSDTNLATMIELPRVVKDELNKEPYKLLEQLVNARLEISPKRNPWRRRTLCFTKD